jgi:hypothetical protein
MIKSKFNSIYVPTDKREVWDASKEVAQKMGLSRSELILQLLGGVVALSPKTEGPAFKLKIEGINHGE